MARVNRIAFIAFFGCVAYVDYRYSCKFAFTQTSISKLWTVIPVCQANWIEIEFDELKLHRTNDKARNLGAGLTHNANPLMSVECILRLHSDLVCQWYLGEEPPRYNGYLKLVSRQHLFNVRLWCLEDQARDLSANFEEIATIKRSIDQVNQLRNDAIESIDDWLVEELSRRRVIPSSEALLNTETPGSVIDRLSILALRIHHLKAQLERQSVDEEHLAEVHRRLTICVEQRLDLARSLEELLQNMVNGQVRHKTYRHLKMYNDPQFNPFLKENPKGEKLDS